MLIKNVEKGFNIIEILLAMALCAILFIPMMNLLSSMYQSMNMSHEAMPVAFLGITKHSKMEILDGGSVFQTEPLIITEVGEKQCQIMNKISSTVKGVNDIPVQYFEFTSNDLDLPASTTISSISLIGTDLILSFDSASATVSDVGKYLVDPVLFSSSYSKNQNSLTPFKNIFSRQTGPGYDGSILNGYDFFAGNMSVSSQSHILNLSQQLVDEELKSYIFPGSNSNTNPITKRIIVYKDALIVGTQKSSLAEIHIFNVHTGQLMSTINTEYGINDIYAYDKYLYVIGPQDPEIQIYSIENITYPILIGEYDAPGGSGNGRTLTIYGEHLYFGRSKGAEEFIYFKDSNTASSLKVGSSIDKIIPHPKGAILFTSNESGEVYYVQILTEPSKLKSALKLEHFDQIDLPGRVSDYACIGNMIFLSIKNSAIPLVLIKFKL